MKHSTAKAKPRSSKSKGKTREVRIRPAQNGFLVSHDKEPASKDAMYEPPEETVHETPESMMNHVGSIFGADQGDGQQDNSDNSGSDNSAQD